MPRDLQASESNLAVFLDGVSNSEVGLYYRTPTNSERIKFKAATVIRKNGKIVDQSVEAQLSFGAKIMTGIREGDFVLGDIPISSDQKSEHYDADWKKLVLETAGDIVQSLSLLAFSGTIVKYDGEDSGQSDENELDMSDIPGLDADELADAGEAGKEDTDSPGPLE